LATIVERTASPSFLPVALKESALAGLVAFLLAFALLGFHLVDIPGGVTVRTRWSWVAISVAVVFAGRFLLVLFRHTHPERFAKAFRVSIPIPKSSRFPVTNIVGGLLAAFALSLPFLPFSDRYIIDISISVLIYVMLGWGLNIVVGLAGLLDLGYVAFYAVGAYSFALLSQHFGLSFWECLPLAGAFAAMFGVLLGFPVLRLRGDYLAIVTLGFGEMIRIILLNWQTFTGGPNGLSQIPRPSFFGFPFVRNAPEGTVAFHQLLGIEFDVMHRTYFLYYVILVLALLTNFFSMRIRKLPVGRAWEALREDEIACRSLGINPTNTKLSAFAIGAMFGGFAGSFFATRQGFISPESFTFPESATILAIVVLGGLGSQLGVVIAAAFLVLAPEFLRDFAQFRMLAFGAAMVAVMIWRPQGLIAHRDPSIVLKPAGAGAR
jgi:branched-chain amino acid transport system permease protein